MERVKVGVIGCGQISGQYLENMVRQYSYCLDVTTLADLAPEAARARAEEFGVARSCTPDELLADPNIEIVVNLTNPAAHFQVNQAALAASKHVYGEKPFTISREEGKRLLDEAQKRNLKTGGAPDTFLGAGIQTCRKLVDDGWIGVPITATGMISFGAARQRYYDVFRGPVFDMAPYYITAMVALLGPVKRVAGVAASPFPERRHEDPKSDLFGQSYEVSTPGNVSGVLEFGSGVVGTITATCETFGYVPRLEILGTEGTLICPDPNNFGGPVILQPRRGERREIPLAFGNNDQNRGLGIADMAYAIRQGRAVRASGELCFHVLDIAHALHESSGTGRYSELESAVERPAPLLPGFGPFILER